MRRTRFFMCFTPRVHHFDDEGIERLALVVRHAVVEPNAERTQNWASALWPVAVRLARHPGDGFHEAGALLWVWMRPAGEAEGINVGVHAGSCEYY